MDIFTNLSVSEIVKTFGPSGIFILYLIWESKNCREDRARYMKFIEEMLLRRN